MLQQNYRSLKKYQSSIKFCVRCQNEIATVYNIFFMSSTNKMIIVMFCIFDSGLFQIDKFAIWFQSLKLFITLLSLIFSLENTVDVASLSFFLYYQNYICLFELYRIIQILLRRVLLTKTKRSNNILYKRKSDTVLNTNLILSIRKFDIADGTKDDQK